MTAKIYPFPKLHRDQLRALLSGRGDPGLEGPVTAGDSAADDNETRPSGHAAAAADRPADPREDP